MAGSGEPAAEGTKRFNSYNQPAINKEGVVVFRARSRGGEGGGPGQGEPERGIYMRNLAEQGPLFVVFRRDGTVPQPNNTTTGEHRPARSVQRVPVGAAHRRRIRHDRDARAVDAGVDLHADDGTETRTGTAGIYTSSAHGMPTTGASMLGDVYEGGVQTFPYFQVPVHGDVPAGVPASTSSRARPRSPSATTIVFKGNFAVDGVGKTGVFYRDIAAKRGKSPIELIASSFTKIPGSRRLFGSTAPPSAGGKYAVFAGYDNEQSPRRAASTARAWATSRSCSRPW